jgi:hypothetical protein
MNRPYLSLVPSIFLLSLITSLSFGQGLSVSSTTSDYNGHAISCHGQSDGSIDLTVSGGISQYTFVWSTADGSPSADGATSEDLSNLSAGNYQVIVNDSVGDVDTLQFVLTQPVALSISLFSPQYNGYNIRCSGGVDGQINATVSGGVAPYTYQWNTGDSVPNIGGLGVGTYQLIVIGANGCSDTATITLTEPLGLTTSLSSPLTDSGLEIPCAGSSSGSIDLTVTKGVGMYLYNWSNGGITQDLNGIGAGWYSVQVSDGNGCVKYDSLELREPTPLTYTGSAYEYQPGEFFSCDTCNDGQATPIPSGGTSPYAFMWSNGQTTQTATGLAPGVVYSFTITDAAGCAVVDSFSLPTNQVQTPLELIGTVSSYPGGYQVSYLGAADGWIDLQVIGGSSPFSYNWSNGATTQDISDLSSGTYTVTVTDNNGAQAERSFTLTAPSNALQVFLSTLHPSCYGQSTGFMEAMVSGGTPPYTYEWATIDGSTHANGSTLFRIENLGAGSYTVIVRDANNDSVTVADTVVVPDEILTSITPSVNEQGYHLLCAEGSEVILDLQVSGGLPPYTYLWDNGKFTQDITVKMAGMFMVQVKDNKNCIRYDSLLVNAPEEVQIDADWYTYANGQLFSCDTCNDAQVTVTFTGGIPPYDIVMYSNTDTLYGPTFTGIYADTAYSLRFEDAIGCVQEMTGAEALVIPRGGFTSLQVDAVISNYPGGYNVSSFGANDGWINLDVSGQMSQETVLWSDGNTQKNRSGMSAGYYEVTVSDNAGQSVTRQFTLIEPQYGMSVQLSGQFSPCMGSGNINAMVMGGTPPYMFHWTGPYGSLAEQWSNITVWQPGNYTVLVTDANNDSTTASINLMPPPPVSMQLSSPTIYGDANAGCTGNDGSIVIELHGGTPPYTISVFEKVSYDKTHTTATAPAGSLNQTATMPNYIHLNTSDTLVIVDSLKAGFYDVSIADMSGCGSNYQFIELTSPPPLQVHVVPTTLPNGYYTSCDTCDDGMAEMQVLNSYGSLQYAWAQVPEEHVPVRLEGATMFQKIEDGDVDPTDLFGGGVPFVIGSNAQQSGLAGEVMYGAFAMDELGCMGGEGFVLEKPKENSGSDPDWKLNGNSGVDALGQQRWLGTNDSTDLVLKSNNLEALKLKADGSTEVVGSFKLGAFEEATPCEGRLLSVGADGFVTPVGPCPPADCVQVLPWSVPPDGNEENIALCHSYTNVGIGFVNPTHKLHVGGTGFFSGEVGIGVGAEDDVKLLVRDLSQGHTGILVQGRHESPALAITELQNAPYFTVMGNGQMKIVGNTEGSSNPSIPMIDVTDTDNDPAFQVHSDGRVNIGSLYTGGTHSDYKFSVKGKVLAKEVYVTLDNWSDFVFAEDYKLTPLEELKLFIATNHHLPDVPSEAEIIEGGNNLGQMDAILLQKIEELTLYVLQLNDKLKQVEEENAELRTRLK